ncbi:GL26346 [Drosophila persimilis]|uniref:GL26346 n=1 Tax=Drosophila persimilis TaxID=7234 RepID=B4GT74_DROPE|nr:GL26346 [Drosophila persimilis]
MDSLQKQHTGTVQAKGTLTPKPKEQQTQQPVSAGSCAGEVTFQRVPIVDGELKKWINFLKRPEMLDGKINFVSHLTYFQNEPFFIMIDEYHIPHLTFLPTPKWKVLAIAASNVSATAFQYLYIRVVPVTDEWRLGSKNMVGS